MTGLVETCFYVSGLITKRKASIKSLNFLYGLKRFNMILKNPSLQI